MGQSPVNSRTSSAACARQGTQASTHQCSTSRARFYAQTPWQGSHPRTGTRTLRPWGSERALPHDTHRADSQSRQGLAALHAEGLVPALGFKCGFVVVWFRFTFAWQHCIHNA